MATVGGWFGDSFWGLLVILGPLALAAAIGWAMYRNKTSKAQYDRTERATRENYDAEARDQRERDAR